MKGYPMSMRTELKIQLLKHILCECTQSEYRELEEVWIDTTRGSCEYNANLVRLIIENLEGLHDPKSQERALREINQNLYGLKREIICID